MVDSPVDQQKVQLLLKFLKPYLDKACVLPMDLTEKGELLVCIQKPYEKRCIQVLNQSLNTKITYGKDRLGQPNGYLVIPLKHAPINVTTMFSAALSMQREFA